MIKLGDKNITGVFYGETPVTKIYLGEQLVYDSNPSDYVDMGEAGIWAKCNIGASKPGEAGIYFQWGDAEGIVKNFSDSNYKYSTGNGYSKYNATDNKTTLDLEDDAAHVILGNGWRIPTKEDFTKLINACDLEWLEDYPRGRHGMTFILKSDPSKRLYFPAWGYYKGTMRYNYEFEDETDAWGHYWSSSLDSPNGNPCYLLVGNSYAYTHTNMSRYYGCLLRPIKDKFNGHDYVDMGDAGIWATCNVGASKPEEPGLYFAWGETIGYPDASGDKKFNSDYSDYKFGTSDNFTKYNSTDRLTTLEPEDDAAHVIMGGDWRMPTKDEFQKLYNLCNIEWTTDYKGTGVKGMVFRLKSDESKQVFFPAAGYCGYGSVSFVGLYGFVWSSSLYSSVGYVYYLTFNSGNIYPNSNSRSYLGCSVRGFIPK